MLPIIEELFSSSFSAVFRRTNDAVQRLSQSFDADSSGGSIPSGWLAISTTMRVTAASSPDDADPHTDHVETHNTRVLDKAREENRDGVAYLTAMFNEAVKSLTIPEIARFKETVSTDNPDLFVEVPHKVVHRLIASPLPLKEVPIPHFAKKYLDELESLRERRIYPMTGQPLRRYHTDRDRVATLLARDVNFTASIEGAINTWSLLKA